MARRADAVTFPRGIGKSSFFRTSDNLKKHSERESPRYDPRTLVRRHYAPAAGPNLLIRPAGSQAVAKPVPDGLVAHRSVSTRKALVSRVQARMPALCCLAFLLFFTAAFVLQKSAHAYQTEIGAEFDDASHYVTGLMVRDYIAQGFPSSPTAFAQNYYAHYPKVGLGHWPPVFYVMEALWMLAFGDSIASVLALMAAITALISATIFHLAFEEWRSPVAGLACGSVFLLLPVVQQYTSTVMVDTGLALLVLWAAIRWGRFLDSGRARDVVWFGSLAALAILTKGDGVELGLLPPISILLTRRFAILRDKTLWITAAGSGLVCLPWMLLTRQFVTPGFQYPWGFAYAVRAAQFFSLHLLTTTGVAITVLFLAGLAPKLLRALRFGGINGRWASLISVVLSVLVLHCFVPSGLNDRYLIAAIPAILLLAFAGGLTLITVLSRRKPTPRVADTVSLVLLTLVFATVFYIPRKQSYGFREAAAYLEQARLYRNQVILCASEAFGEGMLITEMAARDHSRPGHVILRAGRVLASSDWNNQHYRLRFDSAQQIMAYLTAIPVGVLVLDRTPGAQPLEHYQLLRRMIQDYPNSWERIATFPAERPGSGVDVYHLIGQDPVPHHPFEIEVQGTYRNTIRIMPPIH